MRALYISQNGMLENLGQSQVLPYVRGLAKRGVEYDLFAFEHVDASPEAVRALQIELADAGIRYHPLARKRDPRLRTKLIESGRGVLAALGTAIMRRPLMIHGRSYFSFRDSGDVLTQAAPGAKLIFDCRGMLADEYVDCGYWSRDRPEYYLVKEYEARLFAKSSGIVVLTRALREWLTENGWFPAGTKVEAIPCCVDTDKFKFQIARRNIAREKLGLTQEIAIVYSGSLGTWYLEEMARFVGAAFAKNPSVVFCVFTPNSADSLSWPVLAAGLPKERFRTQRVAPKDMPTMLAAGDIGLSFIQLALEEGLEPDEGRGVFRGRSCRCRER